MPTKLLISLAILLGLISGWQVAASRSQVRAQISRIQQLDQSGQSVKDRLERLKDYSASHSWAPAGLTLSSSYQRAQETAQAQATGNSNGPIYAAAQAACTKGDSITQARCVSDYLAAHSTPGRSPAAVELPAEANFRYQFASPTWTADGAGAAALGAVLCLVWAAIQRLRRQRRS